MAIEALEDWNNRITSFGVCNACCGIPGQDGIGYEGESLSGFIQVQGWSNAGNLYTTKLMSYGDGGSKTQTYNEEYYCSLGGTVIVASGNITTVDVPPLTGSITTTYSNIIDKPTALAAGRSAVEAAIDWAGMTKVELIGGAYYESLSFDDYRSISFNRTKFRKADYAISNPPGTYIKFTFDEVDFLEDTTDAPASTDNVLEWTGIFDINDQDNPAHFTDWFYINPPATPGSREMRNLRWTRFQSTRYGNKPQISDANGDIFIGGIFSHYP